MHCHHGWVRRFHRYSLAFRPGAAGRIRHRDFRDIPPLRLRLISSFNRQIHALTRLRLARSSARSISMQIAGGTACNRAGSSLRATRCNRRSALVKLSVDCAILRSLFPATFPISGCQILKLCRQRLTVAAARPSRGAAAPHPPKPGLRGQVRIGAPAAASAGSFAGARHPPSCISHRINPPSKLCRTHRKRATCSSTAAGLFPSCLVAVVGVRGLRGLITARLV